MGNSPNHVVTVELDTMHSSEFQKSTTAVTTTEVLEPPTHRLLGLRAASESRSGFSTTMRQSGQLSSISRPCQQSTSSSSGSPIPQLPLRSHLLKEGEACTTSKGQLHTWRITLLQPSPLICRRKGPEIKTSTGLPPPPPPVKQKLTPSPPIKEPRISPPSSPDGSPRISPCGQAQHGRADNCALRAENDKISMICIVVAAVILSFSIVANGKITSPVSFYTTSGGIVVAFISVFWSFGYIRLSERLRKTANDPSKALTSSANPYYQGIAPGSTPVLALDVFLVQVWHRQTQSSLTSWGFSPYLELLRSVTLPPSEVTPIPRLA
ncbi:Protein TIC 21, chloroplastic [Linum perenne]